MRTYWFVVLGVRSAGVSVMNSGSINMANGDANETIALTIKAYDDGKRQKRRSRAGMDKSRSLLCLYRTTEMIVIVDLWTIRRRFI